MASIPGSKKGTFQTPAPLVLERAIASITMTEPFSQKDKEQPGSSVMEDLSSTDYAAIERRILRTLDFRVVTILSLLFLVSFVDRGNIGNAHIQGLDKSLHLTKNDYNIAVMVFTLGYVVFGVPANLLFKRIGPKSLSAMMFIWG